MNHVDRIKESERKLAAMGVVMSDDEKKQLFFQYFTAVQKTILHSELSRAQNLRKSIRFLTIPVQFCCPKN